MISDGLDLLLLSSNEVVDWFFGITTGYEAWELKEPFFILLFFGFDTSGFCEELSKLESVYTGSFLFFLGISDFIEELNELESSRNDDFVFGFLPNFFMQI